MAETKSLERQKEGFEHLEKEKERLEEHHY